jgi:hypothetical protein
MNCIFLRTFYLLSQLNASRVENAENISWRHDDGEKKNYIYVAVVESMTSHVVDDVLVLLNNKHTSTLGLPSQYY